MENSKWLVSITSFCWLPAVFLRRFEFAHARPFQAEMSIESSVSRSDSEQSFQSTDSKRMQRWQVPSGVTAITWSVSRPSKLTMTRRKNISRSDFVPVLVIEGEKVCHCDRRMYSMPWRSIPNGVGFCYWKISARFTLRRERAASAIPTTTSMLQSCKLPLYEKRYLSL